jgi:diguanylate cyclase (GGDEF)-like protein
LRHAKTIRRATAVIVIGSLTAIIVAAVVGPSVYLPRAAILGPITYAVAALADLATASILIATWRASAPRRSTVALILSFTANAIMLLVSLLALPLIRTVPPVIEAPPNFGVWIFVSWHVLAALGAIAYVVLRNADDKPSPRFSLVASIIMMLLVGGCIFVALNFTEHLPNLARGDSLAGLASSGTGPFAVGILAVATLLLARIREASHIDRALLFALLALTGEMVVLLVGGHRYTTTYYAGRVLILAGSLFVFVAAMRTLIGARRRLAELEWNFAEVAGESEKRGGRIAAVWQIASQVHGSESERTHKVLTIAAQALRPGKAMMGFLTRLDGERIVVEDAVFCGFGADTIPAQGVAFRGASFVAADTMSYRLCGHERATAWDDLSVIPRDQMVDGMVTEALEVQSLIGAAIHVDGKTYFLTFGSPKTMLDEPFEEDDLVYVDVIASFFGSHFEQQQQFRQIKFEIEHDGLTGLENRAQLRAALRDEISGGKTFALAFIDIDGFKHVNSREGNHVGDEVLIEVAKSMVAVGENDLVARVSGDNFAVLIRDAHSADSTSHAVGRYADLFRAPITTTGPEGMQKLSIGASIGVSRFPADGGSVEDLMRRADVALKVAKARGGSKALMFDASMDSILEETRLRFAELSSAIAGDQLALAYQPTFELATRELPARKPWYAGIIQSVAAFRHRSLSISPSATTSWDR